MSRFIYYLLAFVSLALALVFVALYVTENQATVYAVETPEANAELTTPVASPIPGFGVVNAKVGTKPRLIPMEEFQQMLAGDIVHDLKDKPVGEGKLSTASESAQIPVSDVWGPPVQFDQSFISTWDQGVQQFMNPDYKARFGWEHLGVDGKSSDGLIAAFADSVVLAIYDDLSACQSERLGSGGRTAVLATRTPDGLEIHHVYGHLAYPDDDGFGTIVPGQLIKRGEAFARMGKTYDATCGSYASGPHLHFGLAVDRGNGYFWEDPVDWDVFGVSIKEQEPAGASSQLASVAFSTVPQVYVSAAAKFIHQEKNVLVLDEVAVDSSECGDLTVEQAIALAKKVWEEDGKGKGVPLDTWLSLIGSESAFRQYDVDSQGNCTLEVNEKGPAYGLAQIYRPAQPNSWYTPVHPEVNLSDLYDPEYNLRLGMKILLGRPEVDWDSKVDGYKGGYHHDLYYQMKAAGGVMVNGNWISFKE